MVYGKECIAKKYTELFYLMVPCPFYGLIVSKIVLLSIFLTDIVSVKIFSQPLLVGRQ